MNPETIDLTYDLYSLPTAQHKAGLAGLLVLLESMRRRHLTPLPAIEVGSTRVRLGLTQKNLQGLFDELYDASTEEVESKSLRKNKAKEDIPPLRTEQKTILDKKTGKAKSELVYIYPQVVPRATFLQCFRLPEPWIKLWRDVLWSTLRGIPKTRLPYEQRAKGFSVQEATRLWEDLAKFRKAKGRNELYTAEVASSVYIGAQAVNAERVPFLGRPDENLLLNFWPVVMTCWVPQVLNRDGEAMQPGFVLAIPEVSDLLEFVDEYVRVLAEKDSTLAGFRPKEAFISLPEEGALEFISRLLAIAKAKSEHSSIALSLSAVEVFHLEKQGKSVHARASGRVNVSSSVINPYEAIRKTCRHPLFKTQLIRNLLQERSWHRGFDHLFGCWPAELFVCSDRSKPLARVFAREVNLKFQRDFEEHNRRKEDIMNTQAVPADLLPKRVYNLVRAYVYHKTEARSGITWESFKDKRTSEGKLDVPQSYREARQKVCTGAFLALRGRRSREDFVSYFTGTLCSVPQYLPEADYLSVAEALMTERWEEVRNLGMLAISAHSNI